MLLGVLRWTTFCDDELLLCCARTSRDASRCGAAERVRGEAILIGSIFFFSLAVIQWCRFFIFNCSNTPLISYLEEHLHKLKQHYLENSARNTVLTAELCRLIGLFADSGIEAIPYKGPVLSSFCVRRSRACVALSIST